METELWTHIKPWGRSDNTNHWVNGIYKITSYHGGEYYAFYIKDHYKNWGDYVCAPPDNCSSHTGKCWNSLEAAKAACVAHASLHQPKEKTLKRAHEIQLSLVLQEALSNSKEVA